MYIHICIYIYIHICIYIYIYVNNIVYKYDYHYIHVCVLLEHTFSFSRVSFRSSQRGKAQDFDGLGHDFNLARPVSVEGPGPLTKNVDSKKKKHRNVIIIDNPQLRSVQPVVSHKSLRFSG